MSQIIKEAAVLAAKVALAAKENAEAGQSLVKAIKASNGTLAKALLPVKP